MNSISSTLDTMLARRTTVIVVDMQKDFCTDEGLLGQLGFDTSHFVGVAQRLRTFLAATSETLPHRVFVRAELPRWQRSRALREHNARSGIKRQIRPELADWFGVTPQESDYVVKKFRYSAFVDTELAALLKANNTETVIIAGSTTEVCVDSTARSAFMLDYGVIVLDDCSGGSTPERHRHTIDVLDQFFACCVSADAVIESMSRLRGTPVTA